jgi:hypothetical protein
MTKNVKCFGYNWIIVPRPHPAIRKCVAFATIVYSSILDLHSILYVQFTYRQVKQVLRRPDDLRNAHAGIAGFWCRIFFRTNFPLTKSRHHALPPHKQFRIRSTTVLICIADSKFIASLQNSCKQIVARAR